jgi:hypothetical protein
MALLAFENPAHEGNSAKYHTGEICIEKGCTAPAGTKWSHLWCFEHNVARMNRITAGLNDAVERAKVAEMIDKAVDDIRSWAGKNHKVINAMVHASGGTLKIQQADLEREVVYESCSTPGDGTATYHVMLK